MVNSIANENKKYKDTVFTDLFYLDQTAKENLLSLYNALFNEHQNDPEQISLVRLENTLFMEMYNDVAFTFGDRKIVLAEHQSTINENMPVRSLLYLAREYEQYFPTEVRYKRKAIRIPTPEFITFYNGEAKFPLEATLKLSDSFLDQRENPPLELEVRVININYSEKHELLEKCEILRQYSQFVTIVRQFKGDKASIEKAVKQCIKDGILAEYLKRKGSEVVNMLFAEYDYATDIRVQRAEAAEEAAKEERESLAITCHKNGVTDDVISKSFGYSMEFLQELFSRA